jgi:FtsH-binding integral membrane protein
MREWFTATRQRHLRALVRHPHHYVVALGLTLLVWLFFRIEAGTIATVWAYAVLENLTTVGVD